MKIDLNGQLIEEGQAVVSVYDHGFLYGMGLFETFRTYGGRPFLLEWHLERLAAGCAELDMAFVPDPGGLRRRIARILEDSGLEDAYFRYTVTAGSGALGLPAEPYGQLTEVLYAKPLPPADPEVYRSGRGLQRLALPRSTPEGRTRLKSLHYMNNILAKQEMRKYPWARSAEGLFLDGQGRLCEGIVSNVFFVRKGAIHTPAPETGLLCGITRRFVLSLAGELGIPVHEGFYDWEDLQQADEAFLTNSIQEIVPVTVLWDGQGGQSGIGGGCIGPVTERLLLAYRQAAVGEQMKR
ncbi:4-amino-4-deoxychorismate lyase [Paenibacillus mucilaginosus 3016]|uniref:4-amino-4-deoxychorismate lyase n=2 Tax=Paenibacillus mucilaginosus TaxID=61624 RepID=H6NSE0_9BACL|nr:aminotransferase class IV [Paenibacillus mucilaginosus]AFC33690.1 4-amino-4-deoxychorismate lyase [Paenibacillus mucilaginosus 3016]AFH66023.1 4-amino-4-deoxychorismate lyase [Paenibacillus mucilaginosus K02]WFA22093.1 4-amino-4-deoxychorismate lyase [Paenibacillus mucilaginosus]